MISPVDQSQIDTIKAAYKATHDVHQAMFSVWKDESLFTWQWWLGVVLTIAPWVLWFFLRKKESTDRLLYPAFFTILVSSWFDFTGVSLGLWSYNYTVVPTIPAYIPWDYALIPVTTLLVLQYKPNLNPILKAIFIAGMTAFAGEPILNWLSLYQPNGWRHVYSFGIYGVMYFVAHYLSRRKDFEGLSR